MDKHILEKHQVSHVIQELGITGWSLEEEPTTEEEFHQYFTILLPDEDGLYSIESKNPADFGVTWSEIVAKLAELNVSEPLRLLRMERDRLIAETDWWVLGDRVPTQEQLDYRQALRDITDTYTDYKTVVWPEKP